MKRELIYAAAVGGCVGALMTMALGLVLPLGAQNHPDGYFRKVTCTQLTVLSPDLDKTNLDDRTGAVMIGVDEHGGHMHVLGIDSGSSVVVRAKDGGGSVAVFGDNSTEMPEAIIGVQEHGGFVGVNSKDDMKAYAEMSVDEDSGIVTVLGRGAGAGMKVDKHGGLVSVDGIGASSSRAIMCVDEYGNGAVSTWDKNGYRLK